MLCGKILNVCGLPASYNRDSLAAKAATGRSFFLVIIELIMSARAVESVDNGGKAWSLALIYLCLSVMSTPVEKTDEAMEKAQTMYDFERFWEILALSMSH